MSDRPGWMTSETPEEPPEPEPIPPAPGGPAERIAAKLSAQGELPEEVRRIWTRTPQDERRARFLIGAWGLERFLSSALHEAAIHDFGRRREKAEVQKAFLQAMAKKR
jgi:hypothetical protein